MAAKWACNNRRMALPRRITVIDPEFEGAYDVVERRADGSIVLRPIRELLSEVEEATGSAVFVDDEFAAHLMRVAAAEDDLPAASD